MTGAMYAAVAGLKAHMSALNVIGQNISNVNTNAYKSTRYTFLEALYTSVRGGSNGSALLGGKNPAQMGYGSSIGTIDLDMSTKNFTPTGRPTDVMIDGDGFLIVGDKGQTFTSQDDLKNMYLTRLGNLEFDSQGYLVDGQGQVVYGFLFPTRFITSIWIPSTMIQGLPRTPIGLTRTPRKAILKMWMRLTGKTAASTWIRTET